MIDSNYSDINSRFDSQFLSFRQLVSNKYIWREDISAMDADNIEETDEFHYCSSGYQVLDLYCDLNSKVINQEDVIKLFKDTSMTFLLLQRGECEYNGLLSVFLVANERLLKAKKVGLSNEVLTDLITDAWNDYDLGNFDEVEYIKTKFFKVKTGVKLSLDEFRSLIAKFFNKKRYDKMIENVNNLKLLIIKWIEEEDGFISAERVCNEFGVKLPTAKKYLDMSGFKDAIKEYHSKKFKTNRKDNYDTFMGIKSAGYEIHYEEGDIITQAKVSDKTDKALVTIAKNWKPHKEEFNKLNGKIKNK